ncbi:STAS domain-containing protein [Streptomyces sp. NBC_00083]|uniref:STAS domain-containing protein n=1 Tax=Streptomyces sp. NBC_00083 TaxID=2975647 RepID=UPI00224E37C0|nr:STAS domain-containing protein [Streptomyces sp. NBC_00083]MCX5387036.1 STAS domain-containing protein [Streptomyces sp. NBC_00083]
MTTEHGADHGAAVPPAGVLGAQYPLHDAWAIEATGDLDLDTLGPLKDALEEAAGRHRHVILEASRITFCDSSALNVLLHVHAATALSIAAPSESLLRLLHVTGTDQFFTLHPTLEAAASCGPDSGRR